MKLFEIRLSLMLILSTAAFQNSAFAQEASTSRLELSDEAPAQDYSPLDLRLNPELGLSSFNYSGEGSKNAKLSGGATVEMGQPSHKFETGLLLLSSGGSATVNGVSEGLNTTYLTIPLLAKIRLLQLQDSTYYFKVGALTAFETGSTDRSVTAPLNVLGSIGLGARFKLMMKADFLVDVIYNQGIDTLRGSNQVGLANGVLATVGMSFRL